ncbi:sucrase-isomaltase, intestinal [Platysternon megacephalum]|uniref:Sucrase-isomaltase, intestinal n=1 Tax=Platysternon megacephalum TaxID=55544 RepID=A0A4D9F156_9SAUR|nr:sucrase-isomaltase, intestinal [Platysternon megacephalum]
MEEKSSTIHSIICLLSLYPMDGGILKGVTAQESDERYAKIDSKLQYLEHMHIVSLLLLLITEFFISIVPTGKFTLLLAFYAGNIAEFEKVSLFTLLVFFAFHSLSL